MCHAAVALLAAAQILHTPGPMMGVSLPDPSVNRWQSKIMKPADPLSEKDIRAVGPDFFEEEYGESVRPFVLGGPHGNSRLWGAESRDDETPGVRLGRGWGDHVSRWYFWDLAVSAATTTTWRLEGYRRTGHAFDMRLEIAPDAKGSARLGRIDESMLGANGLKLTLLSPTNTPVKVTSCRIVPHGFPVSWRRRVILQEAPERAGLSFISLPIWSLSVNGKKVLEPWKSTVRGTCRYDITGFLKKGENVIRLDVDQAAGFEWSKQTLQIEGFAVSGDGTVTHFPGDREWECSTDGKNWRRPRLAGPVGIDVLPDGTEFCTTTFPLHAGPLAVSPHGLKYPVFDCDGDVAFDIRAVSGLAGADVQATARDAFTGETVETAQAIVPGVLRFKTRRGGAYRIAWELRREGRVLDRDETEMIVAAPLEATEADCTEFPKIMESRKRLLADIDCVTVTNDGLFIDHSYGTGRNPRLDAGKVVQEKGIRFRTTGPGFGDIIAWKIPTGTRGKPHLIEIDLPDTAMRTAYCAVCESLPFDFTNNPMPFGSEGWPIATGAARFGGVWPLSGEVKTLRILYFPASDNVTAYVENGQEGTPAAVSRLRVYEVMGGLPALRMPKTDRLYATHCERPLFMAWGGYVNPYLLGMSCGGLRTGFWAAAYAAIVNRIAYLRYAGHNAAIEGAYMYAHYLPTASGESRAIFDDFDLLYPTLKMYYHNGIRSFVGYEYIASPSLFRNGWRDVSERDLASGRGRSDLQIDRKGKQIMTYCSAGVDPTHPAVIGSMTNVLREIRERYRDIRGVEGVVLQTGFWWQPCFLWPSGWEDWTEDDVGYSDELAAAFTRQTGIALPKDGKDRFARRHAILTSPGLLPRWRRFRGEVLKDVLVRMRTAVTDGGRPWRFVVSPTLRDGVSCPFKRTDASVAEKDGWEEDVMRRVGYDPALYADRVDGIELVAKIDYERNLDIGRYDGKPYPYRYEAMANRGTMDLCRRLDAVYYAPFGLNEHWNTLPKARAWWWTRITASVFDMKPIADPFYDVKRLTANHPPRLLFHTWLDMNLTTAFADEEREALMEYYTKGK